MGIRINKICSSKIDAFLKDTYCVPRLESRLGALSKFGPSGASKFEVRAAQAKDSDIVPVCFLPPHRRLEFC